MRIVIVCLLLVSLAAAAFATNPTRADFEAEIEAQLVASIDAAEVDEGADAATAILVATCKFGRNQCANLIRSLMKVTYEDKMLFSTAQVMLGQDDGVNCLGLLTKVICREP